VRDADWTRQRRPLRASGETECRHVQPKPQFQPFNVLLVEVPPQFIALCEASNASPLAALHGGAALDFIQTHRRRSIVRSVLVSSALMLVGCTTAGEIQPVSIAGLEAKGAHKVTSTQETQYRSCDFESWFVAGDGNSYDAKPDRRREGSSSMFALPPRHREVARIAFPYAIMASNVYREPAERPVYALPGWKLEKRFQSDSGLAFEELQKIEGGRIVELAIVYKGTDSTSWLDWKTNLSIWWQPKQYAEAHNRFLQLLKEERYRSVPISVVGHSLGGGIALNVSLRHSTVERPIRAFVFNTSPRAFYQPIDLTVPVDRYLLDEKAEFLWGGRLFWQTRIRNFLPLTYNFLSFNASVSKPISEHSIYLFSRALLMVAINQGDEYAIQVIRANVSFSEAQQSLPSLEKYRHDLEYDLDYCRRLLVEIRP
jgi:hypothetical protein